MDKLTDGARQAAINDLRTDTLSKRLLLAKVSALELATKIDLISDCPDKIAGTARREMQLRNLEGALDTANTFVEFFIDDMARSR